MRNDVRVQLEIHHWKNRQAGSNGYKSVTIIFPSEAEFVQCHLMLLLSSLKACAWIGFHNDCCTENRTMQSLIEFSSTF